MGKRTAFDADSKATHEGRHLKRQRVENSVERSSPRPAFATTEEVTSSRQLQKALVFEQGAAQGFRKGLILFKSFLDSILYTTDEDDLPRKRAILREYLDSQKQTRIREDNDTNFLANFFQAWEFAAETNFDVVLSQVTANLALLFKVLGSHAGFEEYGALLCKSVLQISIAKRFNRSLSAPANNEKIISPILRLLTEVVRFNEGAHAKSVYAKRDFTLDPKILGRNIGLWRDSTESDDQRRKPSIRVNAVRYLLANLTYQDELAKIDILSHLNIVRAVFDHLSSDPPFLVAEILGVMMNHVFQDKTIPRYVKSKILTSKTLSHIAGLYKYEGSESVPEGQKALDEVVHVFMCTICTSPAYGVMLPSNGYYPPANDEDEGDLALEDATEYASEWGLDPWDVLEWKGRIRNTIFGDFLQTLKPWASPKQQELALAIFKACPELVADYFGRKEAFNYDPKLTATWMGYSSFLYETIQLSVPPHLGGRRSHQDFPPPILTTIQSILPQPLSQQVLTKCLNSNSDLVNFFAVRILVVAFQKMQSVLREFRSASSLGGSNVWEQGAKRLTAAFCRRCPSMKVVVLASKRPEFQKDMMREAITRLIRLYFEVAPQVALREKFDASVSLCNALLRAEKPTAAPEDKAFYIMEVEHWIRIARYTRSMRWWQKNKTLSYSPFVTLLRLVATSSEGDLSTGITSLLATILREEDILQMRTSPTALDALIASIASTCGSSTPSHQVLEFLDDCCSRFIRKPIKYIDDLDTMRLHSDPPTECNATPLSPLLMTLVEQWPFKGGKSENGNAADPLAQWLSKLLYLLKLIGEDDQLLGLVRDSLVSSADPTYQQVLRDSFLWKMGKQKAKEALKLATGADFSGSERSSTSPVPPSEQIMGPLKDPYHGIDLELPPDEDERHPGLNRWKKKDIEEAIEEGDVGELILCLCSKHVDIRIQAVSNIRQLMVNIETRQDPGLLQHILLLGELLETCESTVQDAAFPYVAGCFAARAILILADPTSPLFPKVNKFLLKRPSWVPSNLPRYFARALIHSAPTDDDSYHKEVDWYLEYLLYSLRTPLDMEIFRTRNIFEMLLSHYASPSCAVSAKEKMVRLLLRAVSEQVGGATTLITRCGLLSWVDMRLANGDHRGRELRVLIRRCWETCDKEKVKEWSAGTINDEYIDRLAKMYE